MTITPTAIEARADELRQELADGLRGGRWHQPVEVCEAVDRAIRTVPRHVFCPPGTSLEDAYADDIVRTRHDDTGRTTSSVSAPWLQARMLQQLRVEPGQRILEVGSGGYAACLAAEVAGADGRVVTVDIDQVVVDNSRRAVAEAGYARRVQAVRADATGPMNLGARRFDRIIVTMGVWDIPATWLDLLAEDGVLVVPLRLRHPNECWSIAFTRRDGKLVSESAVVCGFVDPQGIGALHPATVKTSLGDTSVTVMAWDPATNLATLAASYDEKSSVRIGSGTILSPDRGSFVGMRTRLALHMPGLAEAVFDNRGMVNRDREGEGWTTFVYIDGASIAIAGWWPAGDGHELGARGFGPEAEQVARTLAGHISDWNRAGRPQRASHQYRPPHATTPLDGTVCQLPGGGLLAVTQHLDGSEAI